MGVADLVRGSTTLPVFLERGSQSIEARFPQAAVLREPLVELAETLRPEESRGDAAYPAASIIEAHGGRLPHGMGLGKGVVSDRVATPESPYAARGLVIPSRLINDCSVVRFIPSRAAAPRGPPSVQFVSPRTRRMCIRSTASRVAGLSS